MLVEGGHPLELMHRYTICSAIYKIGFIHSLPDALGPRGLGHFCVEHPAQVIIIVPYWSNIQLYMNDITCTHTHLYCTALPGASGVQT